MWMALRGFIQKLIKTGFGLDIVMSNSLLNGFSIQPGGSRTLLELWEVMGRDGVRNTVSCNILIKSLFQNGKVDETLSVWTILGKDDTCCPDSLTMVHGLC